MVVLFYSDSAYNRAGQNLEMNIVTIYDIQNKFIAYSAPFPEVFDVFCEWGSLYILCGDRKVRYSTSSGICHFSEQNFISYHHNFLPTVKGHSCQDGFSNLNERFSECFCSLTLPLSFNFLQ